MSVLAELTPDLCGCSPITIGERGENEANTITFDYSDWIDEYGEGVIYLYVKRKSDTSAYPVTLTTEDGVATWLISSVDTSYKGYGKAEFVFTIDDVIAKTATFGIFVASDLGDTTEDPPDAYETWLDTLTALGAETLVNAQNAANSATSAAESAEDAEDSATASAASATEAAGYATAASASAESAEDDALKAEGYAVGTQDGTAVSSGTYYQNNAQYYAEVAQQGAEASGYAWFDVDESDGQMYVTVTDTLSEDVTFSVDETTGILEVIVS